MAEGHSLTLRAALDKVMATSTPMCCARAWRRSWRELMEAEVAELIGAERGERAGSGVDASQRVSAARVGHAGGQDRAGDPASCARAATSRASWSRASAPSRRWWRWCRRRT